MNNTFFNNTLGTKTMNIRMGLFVRKIFREEENSGCC